VKQNQKILLALILGLSPVAFTQGSFRQTGASAPGSVQIAACYFPAWHNDPSRFPGNMGELASFAECETALSRPSAAESPAVGAFRTKQTLW
jgi:hypothetical protein